MTNQLRCDSKIISNHGHLDVAITIQSPNTNEINDCAIVLMIR